MQSTPVFVSCDTGNLPLVHRRDQQLKVLQRRRWEDSMAQVEDVPRPSRRTPEYVLGALADELGGPEQDGRIEVALDPDAGADPLPAFVERNAPVQRNDVGARRRDRLEQDGGVGAEVNPRDVCRRK